MKYQSNKKDILADISKKRKLALEAIGQYVVGEAKTNAPVDTGLLRSSIDHKTTEDSTVIGTNTEYAGFVEKGTRYQKAQPFLEPAVTKNINNIKHIAEKHFKE